MLGKAGLGERRAASTRHQHTSSPPTPVGPTARAHPSLPVPIPHCPRPSLTARCRVHGLKSGKMLKELRGHTSYVNHVTYSADGSSVVSASSDATVRIWDAKTCEQLHAFRCVHGRGRGTWAWRTGGARWHDGCQQAEGFA